MTAEEVLRESENSALTENQIISHVSGKKTNGKKSKKMKGLTAGGFITAMIVVFAFLFSSGNVIPSAISERLIEETDVQYADAVESKKIVFQQALMAGEIPDDTAEMLKNKGVLVGFLNNDGEFVENNKSGKSSVLKMGDKIITAEAFIDEVGNDVALYDAFNEATYARAAYYFDDEAEKVFKKIGTTRNNYTEDSDFDEVMEKMVGEGSNIEANNVALVEKTRKNEETGETETYYEYEETGGRASSKAQAGTFINEVASKNRAGTEEESTLNSADTLKVADTISKEQRSSLFFLTFMENISKMKAGEGNDSKINEAMNFLYNKEETEIIDVNTGEVIKVEGTAVESPSLYAILAGKKVEAKQVENYSSDRILKTVENQLNGASGETAIRGTVASSNTGVKGSIGRFNSGGSAASAAVLEKVSPTISSSLVDNSYKTIRGEAAGEFLVEGAVNVGKELAKASGATAGDAEAITKYARLNSTVLAMDAKVDRMNRSPFDITSKNTFLGSIFYKIAILNNSFSGNFAGVKTFAKLTSSSVLSLLPITYADETEGYLTTFGDCETYGTILAEGSPQCAEVATFDTSTLENPFNDPGFVSFIEKNTTLSSSGSRTINQNSDLEKFILYNDERLTPLGVVDGGILESVRGSSSSVSFISNILNMIKTSLGASEAENRIATGAIFVNSASNPDWGTYKYAQRYVSLARATAVLKQYSSDETAYNNILYFEGEENPVAALLKDYYARLDN
ncbi:hypothetical protein IKG33_03475 [Candidatus Saccharibacteria bacterium]|nr:hypothetical protein [Candidatus Saccharibacteria bacterium]MBR3132433.1 hypothetical protein [Candidatus Saccharibacteria bacterium]